MEGARAGAGGALSVSRAAGARPGTLPLRQPDSKQPDRRKPVGLLRFRPMADRCVRAYRWVSIMYIWTTTSGENVNGTQP